MSEELKRTLENEIQKLHERLAEAEESLEINKSSFKASEECNHEEINYLTSRVDELQQEIINKTEIIGRQFESFKDKDGSKSEEVFLLKNQLKERIAITEANESVLQQIINEKESIITSHEQQLKSLMISDQTAQQIIISKQTEIRDLQESLAQKTETIKSIQIEIDTLQSKNVQVVADFKNFELETESVISSLKQNILLKDELQSKVQTTIKDQTSKMIQMEESTNQSQQEIEKLKLKLITKNETIQQMENDHGKKIAELNESLKASLQLNAILERDIITKDQMHEQSVISLKAIIDELKNKCDTNDSELNDLKANANDKDDTVTKLSEQNKDLTAKLSKIEQQILIDKKADEAKLIKNNAAYENAIEALKVSHGTIAEELLDSEKKLKLILKVYKSI